MTESANPVVRDRWGLFPDDWERIEDITREQALLIPASGLVPRLFGAVAAMRREIEDAATLLDGASIARRQAGSSELGVGTRVDLLAHQLLKVRAERDEAALGNMKLLECLADWFMREGITLFDTTNQPIDEPDYPEVQLDAALIARFFTEYGMPQLTGVRRSDVGGE